MMRTASWAAAIGREEDRMIGLAPDMSAAHTAQSCRHGELNPTGLTGLLRGDESHFRGLPGLLSGQDGS